MPSQPLKLCVSLQPESYEQLLDLLPGCKNADLIEIRLDTLGNIPFDEIVKKAGKPVIITIRISEEGGNWQGSETDRIEIFRQAIKAGISYLDLEWSTAPKVLSQLKLSGPTRLIISHHTEENDPGRLIAKLQEMMNFPADIYKFVYRAQSLNDCVFVMDLVSEAQKAGKQYVVHAMGENGSAARFLGALSGNAWTYVSHPDSASTAEGQIDLNNALDNYYLTEKSSRTRIVGLVGFPIAQSRGWRLHNRLIHETAREVAEKSLDFLYLNFPAQDFDSFWSSWEKYLDAVSITIPHKQRITEKLDFKGRSVLLSGVCNTAVKKDRRWYGFNTDYAAIYELMSDHSINLTDGVLVYGTGGTTRSAVAVLRELNSKHIYITGRNQLEGEKIAQEFGVDFLRMEQLRGVVLSAIIQTTPVGMYPKTEEIPVVAELLKPDMLAFDVVFNPALTRFLKQAKHRGCRIISGVEMYLRQARIQFELFSGCGISLDAIEQIWQNLSDEPVNKD